MTSRAVLRCHKHGMLAALFVQMILLQMSNKSVDSFAMDTVFVRTSFLMARKKPSMAERRKSRAKRLQTPTPVSSPPPITSLDRGTRVEEPSSAPSPAKARDEANSYLSRSASPLRC